MSRHVPGRRTVGVLAVLLVGGLGLAVIGCGATGPMGVKSSDGGRAFGLPPAAESKEAWADQQNAEA